MSLVAYFERFPLFRNYVLPLIASPTRRRLASGAFWGGVAAVGARVITVVCSFFLARILGRHGFGEYGIINSTAGMVGSMAGMGIGQTVTKYVAEFKLSDPQRAGRVLALTSIVVWLSAGIYAVAFVALAPWLAAKTLAAPHLAPLLRISAITVALGVVNSVQVCSLSGCEAFKANSYINLFVGILQSGMVVLGAMRWGLEGAVVAMAVGMAVSVILTRLVVRRVWRQFSLTLHWHSMWQEKQILVRYSLPTFLIVMLISPVNWATNAFLANQTNGYIELGIFNAAQQWQGAIQFLAGVICTAMIPVMSEKCGQGDLLNSLNITKRMMKGLSCVAVPLAVVLCFFSPLIMRGYGPSFVSGTWVMIMLVATGAMSAIITPIASFVMAAGMVWLALFFNIGMMLTTLLGGWYLVRWGAEGLAASKLIATLVHLLGLCFLAGIVERKAGLEARAHGETTG